MINCIPLCDMTLGFVVSKITTSVMPGPHFAALTTQPLQQIQRLAALTTPPLQQIQRRLLPIFQGLIANGQTKALMAL
jgi:hypothetical protein